MDLIYSALLPLISTGFQKHPKVVYGLLGMNALVIAAYFLIG